MRIATWNVNSIKMRVPRFLPWLDERRPDVVCLQETKLADDAFTALLGDELDEPGLCGRRCTARRGGTAWRSSPASGSTMWCRLRWRARLPASGSACGVRDLRRDPGLSVYVPNGRVPDSEHYRYKLAWLAALRELIAAVPQAAMVWAT